MMRRLSDTRRSLPLLLTLMLAGCGPTPTQPGPPAPFASVPVVAEPETPSAAYDVYRTVVPRLGMSGSGHPVVVRDETSTFVACAAGAMNGGAEWESVVANYVVENRQRQRLHEGRDIGVPYVTISALRLNDLFADGGLEGGWRRFREAYPSGVLLTLSAVGFNAERTRAVVQVGGQCGSLCGVWRDFYLERRQNSWIIMPLQTCSAVS